MNEKLKILDDLIELVSVLPDATGINRCRALVAIAESLEILRSKIEIEENTTTEVIPIDKIKME